MISLSIFFLFMLETCQFLFLFLFLLFNLFENMLHWIYHVNKDMWEILKKNLYIVSILTWWHVIWSSIKKKLLKKKIYEDI